MPTTFFDDLQQIGALNLGAIRSPLFPGFHYLTGSTVPRLPLLVGKVHDVYSPVFLRAGRGPLYDPSRVYEMASTAVVNEIGPSLRCLLSSIALWASERPIRPCQTRERA